MGVHPLSIQVPPRPPPLPLYPGAVSGLMGLGAVFECFKARVSCYLQSASLVNGVLPPVHTRCYTLSMRWILNRLVLLVFIVNVNGTVKLIGPENYPANAKNALV